MAENDLLWDSLDEKYLASPVLPDLRNSLCPCGSSAIFSSEDLEVCCSMEATSEYSVVNVVQLQLCSPYSLLTTPLPVLRNVTPICRPCRDIDLNQDLEYRFKDRHVAVDIDVLPFYYQDILRSIVLKFMLHDNSTHLCDVSLEVICQNP